MSRALVNHKERVRTALNHSQPDKVQVEYAEAVAHEALRHRGTREARVREDHTHTVFFNGHAHSFSNVPQHHHGHRLQPAVGCIAAAAAWVSHRRLPSHGGL